MNTNTLTQIGNRTQNEKYPYAVFTVGDHANIRRFTDIHPATVVEVKRGGTEVVVRCENYELAEGQKPEITPGGFAGHCTNQNDLKWDITENPDGALETFTLRKWRGRYVWTPKNGTPDGRQQLAGGWVAFHDFNF